MGAMKPSIKCTVTALVLSVGISLPVSAQTVVLDDLFSQLQSADPTQAMRLVGRIQEEWGKSGSPSVDLLLKRGQDALLLGSVDSAIDHFTAAIDHDPEFAEAYNGRATAYYMADEIGPSIADIRKTLELNPRHFGAMIGFAAILEEIERPEAALEVYREVSALVPADGNVQEAIDRLEKELEGQSL